VKENSVPCSQSVSQSVVPMSLPVQLRYITGVTVRSLVKPVLKNFPKVNIRTSL